MTWQPGAAPAVLALRARLLQRTRAFFQARALLEVDPPQLVQTPVSDPQIDSLSVRDRQGRPLGYLQTSPEYCMKRLLAAGSPDLYSIAHVFRGGERGRRHLAEFTLVEWYRRGFTLDEIMDETAALFASLAQAAGRGRPPVLRLRYAEAFQELTGIDPRQAETRELIELASRHPAIGAGPSLSAALGEDRPAWLDLIASHLLLPSLPPDHCVLLSHYPACQAALARLAPGEPEVAERFEMFYAGMELANGYRELTDPVEQRRRITGDRRRRAALGLADVPPDERLLAALEHGLPECAGVALGFDRTLTALLGVDDIRQVICFEA